MDGSANNGGSPMRLYSLGGAEAPPDLGADLRCLLGLPLGALQQVWQVLGPSLAEVIAPETEQLLDVFCAAYKVNEDDVARAIKGCRFLIREAARLDVPAGALADDIDRLCPGEALVKELLLAGYEPARDRIRQEILRAAIADHGKLLVGVNWRVDAIQASERGAKLGMPIAMLTLHFRDGGEAGRVTLQVLPDMMGELKHVCDAVLG